MWHNKHPRLQRHVCFPLDSQTVLCFLQFWGLCYVCFDLAVYFLSMGMPTTYLSYLSCCNYVYTLSSERTPIDIQLIQCPIDNLIVIEPIGSGPILSHDTFSILFSLVFISKDQKWSMAVSYFCVFSISWEEVGGQSNVCRIIIGRLQTKTSTNELQGKIQRQRNDNDKDKDKDRPEASGQLNVCRVIFSDGSES